MFGKDFLWGVATAAYQIEGAAHEDGKGPSVWDVFSKTEGKVFNMHNGDIACDSYHKTEEDVKLLKELGVKTYRFSISWPRILPNGIGKVNEKGLSYYEELVDALLEADIEPYITLFHWDYPYQLTNNGGWFNEASSDWFEAYTRIVVERLGSKVKNWMTLNEPQCFIGLGYYVGKFAPGVKLTKAEIIRMSHNVFLAHGKAVRTIREIVGESANVGFAFVPTIAIPNTDTEEDIQAAKDCMFDSYRKLPENPDLSFVFDTDYWFDPIMLGKYPDWVMEHYRECLPEDEQLAADFEYINEEVDYVGLNTYQANRVEKVGEEIKFVRVPEGHPRTALDWLISEEMMYWGTKFIYERYKKPIYITENGLSNKDWIALDGKVHDEARIDFLNRYLLQLEKAYNDGVDIRGYFQWSFLDNFEWAEGYKDRFGLVHVDYATGQRTPKESYYWYKNLIK